HRLHHIHAALLVPAHTLSLHDALRIKATRHEISPACGRARPPRMPLTPAMRPFSTTKRATAAPMIAPPIKADAGVNAFQAIDMGDRKSTRLNSSHQIISYAVFCLKKKK